MAYHGVNYVDIDPATGLQNRDTRAEGALVTGGRRAARIADGLSKTIFVFHAGGAHVLFGDGGVRFLQENLSAAVLRSLVTSHGGEVVPDSL